MDEVEEGVSVLHPGVSAVAAAVAAHVTEFVVPARVVSITLPVHVVSGQDRILQRTDFRSVATLYSRFAGAPRPRQFCMHLVRGSCLRCRRCSFAHSFLWIFEDDEER